MRALTRLVGSPRIGLALALLLPLVVLLPESDYLPIYDARIFANCAQRMAIAPSLGELTCARHPSHAYILLSALVVKLLPGSSFGMLLPHLGFLYGAIAGFSAVLQRVLPDEDESLERTTLLVAFAVNPILLGSTLHGSPDLAVLGFMTPTIAALLAGRLFWVALFGLGMTFSKEVGALLYASSVGLYLLLFICRGPGSVHDRLRDLRRHWPLVLPVAIFGARLVVLALSSAQGQALMAPPDRDGAVSSILADFLSVRLLDGVFLTYSATLLVLHFQWLQALPLLALAAWATARWAFRVPVLTSLESSRASKFVFLLALVAFFVVTRYRTYSNPRYLLGALPWLLLAAWLALRELRAPRTLRLAHLGLVIVGAAASLHATVDPVSKAVFGTFRFGTRTMISATSLTSHRRDKSDSGHGRDHFASNLEIADISRLQTGVVRTLFEAGLPAPLVVDEGSAWHLWDAVDPESFQRTADFRRGRSLPVVFVEQVILKPAPRCTYVLYPQFESIQKRWFEQLTAHYREVRRIPVVHAGLLAEIVELEAKSPPSPAPAPSSPAPAPSSSSSPPPSSAPEP